MLRNVGVVDRIIRVLVGLALIAAWFVWPDYTWSWAFWLGLIPLASGVVGYCPIYHAFGWSTNREEGGGRQAHA